MILKDIIDYEALKKSGDILKRTKKLLENKAVIGMSLLDLDKIAYDFIVSCDAIPAFLDYNGFPKSICLSINDEVVHGIPNDRVLKIGDLLKIDLGVKYKGMCTDSAFTVFIGNETPKEIQYMMDVNRKVLDDVILYLKSGMTFGDLGYFIEKNVKKAGLNIIPSLAGHGIGKEVHEQPMVLNYGQKGKGKKIPENFVMAIEPIVTDGDGEIYTDKDKWTLKTKDGSYATHFEHTVIVREKVTEVLT